jgi:hypothetical protein
MATTTAEYEKGLTFEKVWAALMEDRQRQEEDRREREKVHTEMDRRMEESRKEMEWQMAESKKETDRQIRKTEETVDKMAARVDRVTQNVGGLNRSMGELIETLIAARLWEKFDAYPYNLKQAYQRMPIYEGHTSRVLTDIDIMLVNGEYVMAVEVKAHLNRKDDVDHHLRRMDLIRKYPPTQCIGKKLLGAMAGGAVDPDVQEYAHSAGLFVLELTGGAVRRAEPPQGFAPHQW